MKISNFKTSEKIFSSILTALLLYGSVAFTIGFIFEEFDFSTLILSILFCITIVIWLIVDFIVFSSKTILNENGLLYRTIFRKRFYKWDEINLLQLIGSPFVKYLLQE